MRRRSKEDKIMWSLPSVKIQLGKVPVDGGAIYRYLCVYGNDAQGYIASNESWRSPNKANLNEPEFEEDLFQTSIFPTAILAMADALPAAIKDLSEFHNAAVYTTTPPAPEFDLFDPTGPGGYEPTPDNYIGPDNRSLGQAIISPQADKIRLNAAGIPVTPAIPLTDYVRWSLRIDPTNATNMADPDTWQGEYTKEPVVIQHEYAAANIERLMGGGLVIKAAGEFERIDPVKLQVMVESGDWIDVQDGFRANYIREAIHHIEEASTNPGSVTVRHVLALLRRGELVPYGLLNHHMLRDANAMSHKEI